MNLIFQPILVLIFTINNVLVLMACTEMCRKEEITAINSVLTGLIRRRESCKLGHENG